MAREYAVVPDDDVPIPLEAYSFEGFLRWVESDRFPQTGRIDYVAGDVEAEMSPEDLHTHGIVKAAIASALQALIADQDLGEIFVDRARIHSPTARLSVEPDVVVVLWETLEGGRVRYLPAARKGPDRFSAMEGAPDLIVEILSDSSLVKDTHRLPLLYAAAGIPELWLVDARGGELRFDLLTLREGKYVRLAPAREGWLNSPRLGIRLRLVRKKTRISTWRYILEHQSQ